MSDCKLLEKIKKKFVKSKRLDNEDLNKVVGGNEPEEFEWKTKGYVTPVKEPDPKADWAFDQMGNKDKLDRFKDGSN